MEHDERNMLNFSDGQKINMTIPERIGKFFIIYWKTFFWGGGEGGGGGRGTVDVPLLFVYLCLFNVFELTHLTVE